jgi:hypothetical protein
MFEIQNLTWCRWRPTSSILTTILCPLYRFGRAHLFDIDTRILVIMSFPHRDDVGYITALYVLLTQRCFLNLTAALRIEHALIGMMATAPFRLFGLANNSTSHQNNQQSS